MGGWAGHLLQEAGLKSLSLFLCPFSPTFIYFQFIVYSNKAIDFADICGFSLMSSTRLLYHELSYKLRGCFFDVYNELGFGHKESIYHKALEKELTQKAIPYKSEANLNIFYKGERVGNYKPDFLIDNKIIIEIKALDYLHDDAKKQLVYYLKGTEIQLGFLVNFGGKKLEIVRRIWTIKYPQ